MRQVEAIVQGLISSTVGESAFQHATVERWTNAILEGCLKQLAGLGRPLKYMVNVNLAQKAGAGMHVTSATVWDGATDGKAAVHWTNAAGVLVLAVVYWVAM